jgi:hypothetical protein
VAPDRAQALVCGVLSRAINRSIAFHQRLRSRANDDVAAKACICTQQEESWEFAESLEQH